ncbi:hypothetical protein BYT27DRAFT_7180828 [Phlegmacium glaucopus]|nr:hypothetical protein BYT27DRAFT_7180828 [Phlegmacium glaucopus]
MASAAVNYSATSSSTPIAKRPKLNGRRSSTGSVARTKILLLGLRRAGKTSIQQVLFNSLPPKQSFYLETTLRIVKHPIDTVIPLEIWDCPANITVDTLGVPLSQFSTIVFVIDIRDLYNQPISKLVEFIVASYHQNPGISLEVFVHKAEKLQEDDKIENFRQIHERVSDRLLDISPEYEQMQLNFHLTSVYDHSLHEAFSKVLHKLIESLPFLEELLNVFCANSQSPKAFLFDTKSRLYIATDASPVDSATHNLCCDYLYMLNSFGPLYTSITADSNRRRQVSATAPTPPPSATSSGSLSPRPDLRVASSLSTSSSDQEFIKTPQTQGQDSQPLHHVSPPDPPLLATTLSTPNHSQKQVYRNGADSLSSPQRPYHVPGSVSHPGVQMKSKTQPLFYPSASTSLSNPSSPSGGTTLTYHLITRHLALLAVIPTPVYEKRKGLVEYNVVFFREGVQEICDVEDEVRGGG